MIPDTDPVSVPPVEEPVEPVPAETPVVAVPESAPVIDPTPEPVETQPEPEQEKIAELQARIADLERDKEALIHALANGDADGYEHVTIEDLIARGDDKPAPEPGSDLSTSQF